MDLHFLIGILILFFFIILGVCAYTSKLIREVLTRNQKIIETQNVVIELLIDFLGFGDDEKAQKEINATDKPTDINNETFLYKLAEKFFLEKEYDRFTKIANKIISKNPNTVYLPNLTKWTKAISDSIELHT